MTAVPVVWTVRVGAVCACATATPPGCTIRIGCVHHNETTTNTPTIAIRKVVFFIESLLWFFGHGFHRYTQILFEIIRVHPCPANSVAAKGD
jgi:hypothetical protein